MGRLAGGLILRFELVRQAGDGVALFANLVAGLLDAVLREVGGKALDRSDAQVYRFGRRYLDSVHASRRLRETEAEILDASS